MRAAPALVSLIAAVTVAASAWAQSAPVAVTVDELVARAVEQHPDLQAARLEVDAGVARVRQAALRPNPILELGGQTAISPDNNLTVGVSVPLDLNGRKEGRIGVAAAEVALKRAQLAERERRLRAEVRFKAGEVFAARRNADVTVSQLDAVRRALVLVRSRVREGAAPEIDENLLLVEFHRLETARQTLESRVEVLTAQLAVTAGVPADTTLSLLGDLSSPQASELRGEALKRALDERPDIVAARTDVALAQARVRKEEAEGRWDASVNAGYQRQEMGFDLRGLTDSGASRPIQDVFHFFGGGVSITLPVRNRNQGNVAAAMAESHAAERRLALAELTAQREAAAAFVQYGGARRALEIYERAIRDVAARNVDTVRQAWELGRGSLLDVIAEQRRALEIEHGYTEALKAVYDAVVEVSRTTGGSRP
jgi:cobalt-zinc-cadmium efflux system outer membrane protein